jgi:uncharacterized protein YecE (DUF72 family)
MGPPFLCTMKFGKVQSVTGIDLSLPPDHPDTQRVLQARKRSVPLRVHVGCAKWNRKDLSNFYPRGVKDELVYYASQFNAIELNATFYRFFPPEQFATWARKVPEGFIFSPKVTQDISHWKRLSDSDALVAGYTEAVRHLGDRLGPVFLQLNETFKPKEFDRVREFLANWPDDIPLAIEFRHTDWYNEGHVAEELYRLLEKHHVMNIITDTAGRRDLLHMRLTTPSAFVRYVGANDPTSDRTRLDDWVERLKSWSEQGLQEVFFYVHQNHELESPLLAAEFIKKLNQALGIRLKVPVTLDGDLFGR